jgi:choloylglycine hydrolase
MMKTASRFLGVVLAVLCGVVGWDSTATACTGIRLKAKDGAVIYARTLEDAIDFQSNMIVVPRGKEYVGTRPDNQPGLHWTVKNGFVGPNALGMNFVCDGMNEKGLAVGNFQFTGFVKYQNFEPENGDHVIASYEVVTYLLGTCGTVDEAIAALKNVCVCAVGTTAQDHAMGDFHYCLHDAEGHCTVVEYIDGNMTVHNDSLGVVTNSPPFDWQVTNLRNYLHLDVDNASPVNLSGTTYTGFGQGTGLLGMPGDFTPPSRFVRAVTFTQASFPCESAEESVLQAFHLLNQFDIPPGAVRVNNDGKQLYECTRWTTAADLQNLRYYFHTFQSRRIRMVDLNKADFDAKEIKTISMREKEVIEDVLSSQQ